MLPDKIGFDVEIHLTQITSSGLKELYYGILIFLIAGKINL